MKRKPKRSSKAPPPASLSGSLEFVLRELFRRMAPPEAARRHFQAARLEILKGMRALLDARIQPRSKRETKGHVIPVE